MPEIQSATGGRFSVAIGAQGDSSQATPLVNLATVSATNSGYIEYVEGCNEPNTFGVSEAEALAAQQILYSGVSALSRGCLSTRSRTSLDCSGLCALCEHSVRLLGKQSDHTQRVGHLCQRAHLPTDRTRH